MYFVLTQGIVDVNKDAILQGQSLYIERLGCSFEKGVSLTSERIKNSINFRFDKSALRGDMTDHLNINSIPGPVFSFDTKMLFDKIGIFNIEYYHILLLDEFPEIKQEDNKKRNQDKTEVIEYTNYFIANILGLLDCVDHKKSVLEYFYPPELRNYDSEKSEQSNDESFDPFADENLNDIDFVTKLVLDESKIDPEMKVFRLKDKPDLLVFHESVVDLIRYNNLTGFVFVPVSEYTDVIPDDDTPKVPEPLEVEKKRIFFG